MKMEFISGLFKKNNSFQNFLNVKYCHKVLRIVFVVLVSVRDI